MRFRPSSAPCALALLVACAVSPARRAHPPSEPLPESPFTRARVARVPSRQVVIDDRDGLSPDEAALLAVDENQRLRAVRAQRGIAGAELVAAGLLPNPELEATLDLPLRRQTGSVIAYGAGLSWNISPLLSLAARRAGARDAAQAVDLEVAWQEWQVAQAARLHTLRVQYLTRRREAAREIESSWERRAAALAEALRGNAVTALEVAAVERSLGEARLAGLELERELGRARVDLNEVLGVEPHAEVRISEIGQLPAELPALDPLLEQLPARRLDLIGLRLAERSRDGQLRAARAAQFPPLEIGARVGRELDGVKSAGASVSLELPFFERNQAGVARVHAEGEQIRAEYAARLAEGRAQLVRLERELEVVRRELELAGEVAEAAARLAELARQSALRGGLTPVAAAELEERAASARLRQLETEQLLAELWIALGTASGSD